MSSPKPVSQTITLYDLDHGDRRRIRMKGMEDIRQVDGGGDHAAVGLSVRPTNRVDKCLTKFLPDVFA